MATLLLPADIAVRRLAVTRKDVQRAWAASVGRIVPAAVPTAARSERVARLFQAKERAGTSRSEAPGVTGGPAVDEKTAMEETGGQEREVGRRKELPVEMAETPESDEEGTLAARLLERRQGQRAEPEDRGTNES
jgi:hypothetical protein